jgi:hypothetical protein
MELLNSDSPADIPKFKNPIVSLSVSAPKVSTLKSWSPSNALEYIFFRYTFAHSNSREDRVQSPDAQGSVCGNCNPMWCRLLGLKDNVASNLMHSPLSPVFA